jgi:hypothetical protein
MSFQRLSGFTPFALAAGMLACGADRPLERAVDPVLKVEVGQPVPDIVLPSLQDGRPAALAQFRGKKVLLHVFASW